ncbi:unnamed protein product [Blepharisma stoltei]|uniref:Uncharacterized protein n=1 Tax=Blepharisma stoltei TaxID=1481888 RepID=A0AAU9K5C3_9CILI|nr:unnamed protein product [Blepharisma stoltei]
MPLTPQHYIGVGLPKGFSTFTPTITVGGVAASTTYYASNSNDYMIGGFVMGRSLDYNCVIPTAGASIAVTGLWAPGYAGADHLFNIVNFNIFAVPTYDVGGDCRIAGTTAATGTVTTGSITDMSVNCFVSSISASGPDSVDSTMTISLTTLNRVPKNGIITLWLDSSWGYNLSKCSAIGINDMDTNYPISCTISPTSLVITSFAAISPRSIQIIIYHVLPPASPGTYNCITAAATQDSAQNYIEYGSGLTQGVTITTATPVGSTSSMPI